MTVSRRERVRDFLRRKFRHEDIADDDDIFARGFANSLFALELVEFVEGSFRVVVEEDDLHLDNFRSVDRICGLLDRKLDDLREAS